MQAACERLEQRFLFSTVTWTSGSSGSWDVGSNWSGGAVPASGDTVVINQPGVTVTINNSESINSLSCADNLTIASGSLNIGANSEIDGSFTIGGSGVSLGNATLKVTGATEWDSSAISSGTLQNTGTLTLGSTNDKSLNSITLDNTGTIDQALGRLLFSASTLTNASGATYNFQTDNGLFNNGYTNNFNNSGTLEKTAGTGTSTMSVTFADLPGSQIVVQTGTISLNAGGSSTAGNFNVAAGAALDLTGGGNASIAGTYTGSGAGQVQMNNGTLSISGTTTFNFPAGLFQWIGGVIGGSGTLVNSNVVTLSSANDKSLNDITLNNTNTITQVEGRLLLSAAAVNNESGALYDIQTDNGIFNNGYTNAFNNSGTLRKSVGTGSSDIGVPFYNVPGAIVFVETGTIAFDAGGSSTGGTFNVSSGSVLDLTGGGNYSLTGTYTGSGGGNVELNNGTLNITGGVTFNFAGSYFQWIGGVISGGTLTNAGSITLASANDKSLNSATLVNNGTVTQLLGRLLLSASAINNPVGGLYDIQTDNGIFNNGYTNAFNNSGTLRKSVGTGNSSISVPFYSVPNAILDVQTGTVTLDAGGNNTGGVFNVSGGATLDLTGGGNNTFSGTYTGSGAGIVQLSNGTLNVGTSVTFELPGTLFQWLGGVIAGGTFVNASKMTLDSANDKALDSATLETSGTTVQLLGRLLLSASTLTIDSGGVYDLQTDNGILNNGYTNVVNNNGTLRKSVGTGTSQINMNVTNNGTIEVDTGTINLSGTLTENSTGTITTRIFNQGAGQLSLGNAVALAGTLNVALPTGFVPVQGNTYNVVTYPSQTGSFSSINGLTGPSIALTPNTGSTATTITVGAGAPQPQVDLTIGSVNYTPASIQAGATFSVTGSESNAGPGAAGAYDVAVVLSPDQIFGNANDVVLSTVHETGLGSGAVQPFTASGTIPTGTPAGNYYVLAQIDSGQVINETSYANELYVSTSPNVVILASPSAPPAPPPPNSPPPPPPSAIGGLDPTFGTNGIASHNVGFTSTSGVAVQSDGKSVIAGTTGTAGSESFGLTRYNADGSLDTTFGTNGVVTTNFGGDDQSSAVVVLPDGDILVAGTDTTSAGSQFALAEYTTAGALDTTFGNGTGKVLTSFSMTSGTLSHDIARAMAVATNGTIYLGGSSNAAARGLDFAIAAYNSDGSTDTHFGGGTVLKDFSGGDDVIYGLAIQTNGDVVAAGSTTSPSTGIASVGLARFLTTGVPDKAFGSKGQVVTTVRGVADVASSVAIDHTGKIIIGGLSATGSSSDGSLSSDFLVIRYNSTGAIDRTFGKGPVITGFGQPAAVSKVVIESDGKIVASGKSVATLSGLDTSQLEIAVARYNTNGGLDPTFDMTGTALFNLSGAAATPAVERAQATAPSAISSFEVSALSIDNLTLSPQDSASTLLAEFQQFEQSSQGVVAVTQGGELLDVGNSGANTVEAAIVAAGIDLAAQLLATLPAAVVGGAKGMATVRVTETGTDPASGTITIQLFASPDPTVDSGLSPFQSFPERINLRTGQGISYRLRYALPTSLANGNYYLVTYVDTGSVRDLSVANNTAASTSTVDIAAPFVDLSGSGLAPVGQFKIGKPASIAFTVINDGNVPAKGTISVEVLASVDGMVADGIMLATPGLSLLLNPGITRHVSEAIRIPSSLAAGSYFLVAVLDSGKVLDDPNVTNNVLVSQSTVNVT